MKFIYLLLPAIISVVIYADVEFSTGIVNTTRLNGEGCTCHNIDPDANVHVWIEGPDSLVKGETAEYHIFLTGGPMVKGGFNVASRFSTLSATDPGTQIIAAELTHNQPRNFNGDTVSWYFNYTAADSIAWDTLYSTANSVNGDGIPSNLDHWNFGANFPVKILENVPVEFIAFSAFNSDGLVNLKWSTSTETNNKGFEIERKNALSQVWNEIGFVGGNGTTSGTSEYSFSDFSPLAGANSYRLKQIDFNGSFSYSKVIEVSYSPMIYSLAQNYPNPFNPTTTIEYNISQSGKVTLKVFDLSGREVSSLVNGYQNAGRHSMQFNASTLASGMYIYRLSTDNFSASKKLLLMK